MLVSTYKNSNVMESSLQNSLPVPTSASAMKINIFVHDNRYTLAGHWEVIESDRPEWLNDLQKSMLSFNYLISIEDENYLIHPAEIGIFEALVGQMTKGAHTHFMFRIVLPDGEIRTIDGQGTLSEASVTGNELPGSAVRGGDSKKTADADWWVPDLHRLLFTKVIESSPDIIQIVNMHSGRSTYINRMLLEELQYPFGEIKRIENEGSLDQLIHPADADLYHTFLAQIGSAADDDTIETEIRWRAFHGGWMWFRTRARVFGRDERGAPLKFLAFSQNVTDRKVAEEEKHKHHLLREMEKARTAFFNHVSHEFRTPLTLLLAPLQEIIQQGTFSADGYNALHMAYRNALRLQKLVNSLLDFASIESGKLEAVFRPADLAAVTTDLASNFRGIVEQANLKFTVRCDVLSEPVYINHEMYEKILFNLLSNAFKFTFEGKIGVRVKENKNHVKLVVSDTGVGMRKGDIDKVFDRFVRIEGVRARTYEGSGIGLSLVRELVAFHGASIKVTSAPEQGTVFAVIFLKGKRHLRTRNIHESRADSRPSAATPYVEELKGWTGSLEDREYDRTAEAGSAPRGGVAKPYVLVVDDNADMRAYLQNLLVRDYEVRMVSNGKAALEFMANRRLPDVILADVMMPEMDGFALLEAVKANALMDEIPFLLVSARAADASRMQGLRSGADDYLVKPFSAHELLARLDARIQIARVRRAARQGLLDVNDNLEKTIAERTSALQQANAALVHKNAELENVNAELSTFAFAASHDLSEPLRKIMTFTSLLVERERTPLSPKGKELVDKISASAIRMKSLIEEILLYAHAQLTAANIEHISLNSILEDVKHDLFGMILEKRATIEHGKLPVIRCDPMQFLSLFKNIVLNSMRFCPPDRLPHIVISASLVEGKKLNHPLASAEKQYLKIAIKDNGIGFDPKYNEKIFQMFQRLHGHGDYPGMGMGLTICKKVVENHGGFMLTDSRLGEGATFCCHFPTEMIVDWF
jgi:signal transduction histidine kinase